MLDESILSLLGYWVYYVPFILFLMANNVDPDQMPQYVASDVGLHCLPLTLLWVSW